LNPIEDPSVHLYADASAVLAWLLEEQRAEEVAAILDGAGAIVCSELTLIECDRALLRLEAEDLLSEPMREQLAARLASAAAHWTLLGITAPIVLRARLPFARRPVRTLDAIHLASALEAHRALPGISVLSLDDRMRRAARAIGLDVLPTFEPPAAPR
jgi:predicted nucleic acid-binding protein